MKTLLIEKQGVVTKVILNRPDVHNAFNEDLMQELNQAFLDLTQDATTRVVVLTAQGKSFCAGGDLHYMKSAATKNHEQNVAESLLMAALFQKIRDLPKPVIGLINGPAFGGGMGLVCVCDIVLARDSALFALSEVKLGLAPSVISPFVLEKMGVAQARRYFLTGERFDAPMAKQMGIVHEIVTAETEASVLQKILGQILSGGPEAISAIKNLIRKNQELKGQELTEFTADHIARLRASQEAQEGITAFFEKRPANFIIK